ncbi:MAG: hypothetical protein ABIG89_07295 [Candidatus Woesearchaeota archaeon]
MTDQKLIWCCKQKRGITLIDFKYHLSESYLKEADETIEMMIVANKKWKVITGYYACYHALYSILMKAGVKSEIHDCTIELMKLFEEFNDEEYIFLKKLKKDRIDAQYYIKDVELKSEDNVKSFVIKCKLILNDFNKDKIERLRVTIRDCMKDA